MSTRSACYKSLERANCPLFGKSEEVVWKSVRPLEIGRFCGLKAVLLPPKPEFGAPGWGGACGRARSADFQIGAWLRAWGDAPNCVATAYGAAVPGAVAAAAGGGSAPKIGAGLAVKSNSAVCLPEATITR